MSTEIVEVTKEPEALKDLNPEKDSQDKQEEKIETAEINKTSPTDMMVDNFQKNL